MSDSGITTRCRPFTGLSAGQFHDILRLRISVFVVEQHCAYAELDGRDILPGTLHMWIEEDGAIVAYLRVYPGEEDADWIGRVVTAPAHRHRGLAAELMREALDHCRRPARVAAQSHLAGWYAQFGFVRSGPEFREDGILHTPMRLS